MLSYCLSNLSLWRTFLFVLIACTCLHLLGHGEPIPSQKNFKVHTIHLPLKSHVFMNLRSHAAMPSISVWECIDMRSSASKHPLTLDASFKRRLKTCILTLPMKKEKTERIYILKGRLEFIANQALEDMSIGLVLEGDGLAITVSRLAEGSSLADAANADAPKMKTKPRSVFATSKPKPMQPTVHADTSSSPIMKATPFKKSSSKLTYYLPKESAHHAVIRSGTPIYLWYHSDGIFMERRGTLSQALPIKGKKLLKISFKMKGSPQKITEYVILGSNLFFKD